jgi:hypothetical protein
MHKERTMHAECYLGNLKATDNLGDLGTHGRIIVKLISKKYNVGMWN